jgi:predicted transposase YbfD/YdcC
VTSNDLGYHTLIVSKVDAVPALSSSPLRSTADDSACPRVAASTDQDCGTGVPASLLSVLGQLVDPRKRRGVRHRLAVALAATLAGARSFTAIAEWAADTPEQALHRLGVRRRPSSEPTIRRLVTRLPADTFDAVIGAWMWLRTSTIEGRRVIAFDGKTLRGARDATGNLVHLLAGLCQRTGAVLAQVAVGAKTNEIPMLAGLLKALDIAGVVVTADAMHCQRETAQIIRDRGGHYILTVKGNQPNLRKRLKSLPWKDIPILAVSRQHGHGRHDARTMKATELSSGIGFPGAAQVLRLTRTRTIRTTGKRTRETAYAITSLTVAEAAPRADRRLAVRALADREPGSLGPGHGLRRGLLPHPHRISPASHGHPPQYRPRSAPHGRPHQHRSRAPTSWFCLREVTAFVCRL